MGRLHKEVSSGKFRKDPTLIRRPGRMRVGYAIVKIENWSKLSYWVY